MPVPSTMQDLSVLEAGNSPDGAVDAPSSLDNHIRAMGAIVRRTQARAASVASAATVDLGAIVDGEYLHITGTTTITSFGSTGAAGIERELVFDDALTLTHSSNLILPDAANITTVAGDCCRVRYEGSSVWRVVSYESGHSGLVGHGNKLINGNFVVNQRAVSGTVVLAAGAYGHDRWKAGASGCTYTFATSNGVTTLTITAGSLQQTVDGANLLDGTHVMSWTGTAQGKIGGGSYSASGVTASLTGGSNLTVEFGTGTLAKVQLEPGAVATPFEMREYATELWLCQYDTLVLGLEATALLCSGFCVSSTRAWGQLIYPRKMRSLPAVTMTAASGFSVRSSGGSLINCTAVTSTSLTKQSVILAFDVASGLAAGNGTQLETNVGTASVILETGF